MNTIHTRPEKRFVRKDLAIAITLIISSVAAAHTAFAEEIGSHARSKNSLPTLVDPAGILDPELLSTLNAMSGTSPNDEFLDDEFLDNDLFKDEYLDEDSWDPEADTIKLLSSSDFLKNDSDDIPALGAAMAADPDIQNPKIPVEGEQAAQPSLIDPTAALEELGLTPASSGAESPAIEQLAELKSKETMVVGDASEGDLLKNPEYSVDEALSAEAALGLDENDMERDENGELIIDPHLPAPVMPSIVITEKPDGMLEFPELLTLALADNPAVIMSEERVNQAVQQSQQIGAFRYPTVALTSSLGPEYNDPVESEESGVAKTIGKNVKLTMTKLLYDGGVAKRNLRRSDKLIDAAEAESRIEIEDVLLQVVTHYVDYWRFQLELGQAETFVDRMNELVEDLDSMFKAGAVSKLEVDFARARMASARGAQSEATASMNNAFSELEFLVPGLSTFTAKSPDSYTDFNLLTLDEYLEKGAASNTAFVTNQMNVDATRYKVESAKGQFKPTVNVELSGSYIDDEGQESEPRYKAAAKFLVKHNGIQACIRRR